MVNEQHTDEDGWNPGERGPGKGIDAQGGPVIDPTKNVLDLAKAESKYQDAMRDASERFMIGLRETDARFQNAMRDTESRIQNWMRDAQDKRIAEIAAQRQFYETRIADLLRTSGESTSALVSTQLVQIQNTFNERVAKLEQFRWESGGKTSVSDPALADAMSKMAESIQTLTSKGDKGSGRGEGRHDVVGWIIGGVGLASAIMVILWNVTHIIPH
jgi:hypothetical protein